MFCAIRYHLYNLKNMKNTHGRVLFLVTLLHGCFSSFLNCTNYQIAKHYHIKISITVFIGLSCVIK